MAKPSARESRGGAHQHVSWPFPAAGDVWVLGGAEAWAGPLGLSLPPARAAGVTAVHPGAQVSSPLQPPAFLSQGPCMWALCLGGRKEGVYSSSGCCGCPTGTPRARQGINSPAAVRPAQHRATLAASLPGRAHTSTLAGQPAASG